MLQPRPSRLLPPGAFVWLLSFAAVAAADAAGRKPPADAEAAAATSRWVLDAGETPAGLARLLYPGNATLQARFVERVRAANPQLGDSPPAGTEIVVPDLRRVPAGDAAAVPPAARAAAGDAVLRLLPVADDAPRTVPGEPTLRLAGGLADRATIGDAERQLLRLEYRLIAAMAVQAQNQRAILERLQLLEQTQESLRERVAASTPLAPDRPPIVRVAAPAPVAAAAPLAAAPSPAAAPTATNDGGQRPHDLLLAASGLAAAILLLAAATLFVRRRWAPAPGRLHRSAPAPASAAAFSRLPPAATPTVAPAGKIDLPDGEDRSVVELAEMMLGFGRVAGAAEVLRRHIEANPGEALKPWVMLLDVYRRAGMAAEFKQAAWRLHKHFNVQVEDWDPQANLSFLRHSLEAYPHLIEPTTTTWRTPDGLRYLHRLLRDNRAGQRGGFPREVADEIILLIEIMESDPVLKAAAASTGAAADNTSQRRE